MDLSGNFSDLDSSTDNNDESSKSKNYKDNVGFNSPLIRKKK